MDALPFKPSELPKANLRHLPSFFHVSGLPAIPLLWSHEFNFLQTCCVQHHDIFLYEGLFLVPCVGGIQDHSCRTTDGTAAISDHRSFHTAKCAGWNLHWQGWLAWQTCSNPAWWEAEVYCGCIPVYNWFSEAVTAPLALTGLLTLNPALLFGRTWGTQPLWAVSSAQQQVRGPGRGSGPVKGTRGRHRPWMAGQDHGARVWTCRVIEGRAMRQQGWSWAEMQLATAPRMGAQDATVCPGAWSQDEWGRGCTPLFLAAAAKP